MHAVKLAGQADPALDVQVRAPASPGARPASPVTKFAGDRPTPFRLHSNPLMVRAAAVLRLPWASATSGQRAGLCVRAARTSRLGLECLRIGGCGGARNTSNSPLGLGSHAAARSLPDSSIKCSNTRMPPGLSSCEGCSGSASGLLRTGRSETWHLCPFNVRHLPSFTTSLNAVRQG